MINVLELRPNPTSKSNGIDMYCNALKKMFEGDESISVLPVENYPMEKGGILKDRYKKGVLPALFNNCNIDVVHINGFASFSVIQAFWYAKRAKKRIVYTAHWHPFQFLNHPFRAKVFFYLFLRPLVRKYADVVVTINNEDTSFFRKFHSNVVKIPHWIDSESIDNKIKKDPNMILFVGRFNDVNKGAEHLFHLSEGLYNIHCVGPNEGNIRGDMISHINISDEELHSLYEKSSLLVVPSKYEAFSYVALEALSFGTPVLLSDRVRIGDYLNGIEGVSFFKYHDFDDFCDKVHSGLSSTVNRTEIHTIFSKDKMRNKYREMYISCVRKELKRS